MPRLPEDGGRCSAMTAHRMTLYESLVRQIPVTPARAGVGLTAAGRSTVRDYGDDNGGRWYACSCGKQFHDEETAWEHLTDVSGGEA